MDLRRLTPTGTIVNVVALALAGLFMIGQAEAQQVDHPSKAKRSRSSAFSSNRSEAAEPNETAPAAPLLSAGAPVTTQTASASHAQTTASAALSPGQREISPVAEKAPEPPVIVHPSKPVAMDLNTTIPLSLNNVPLDQLIRFVAETTGKTVMKQRDINAQVTVNAPKPVTKREALELIYGQLQLENIFVAEQDNLIQLISFQNLGKIKLENIPATVDIQQLTDSLRVVRKFYKFTNIQAEDVRRHLEIFMPNLSITIEPRSNTLVLTDQLTRIKAFDQVIRVLDTAPDDKEIEVYKLTSANANELALLIRTMITNGALAETTTTHSVVPVDSITTASLSKLAAGGRPERDVVIRPVRTGSPSDVVLIPDARNNAIIALCPKAQKAALDRLITEFDTGRSDDRVLQIYKLKNTDAAQLISLLNTIITNKGLGSAPASGSGPGMLSAKKMSQMNESQSRKFWKRMAEMSGSGGLPTQSGDVLMIPEPRQNWIIAIMRPDLKKAVDDLVSQFDIERSQNVQVRMLDLNGGDAVTLASTVTRLLSDMPVSGPRDYIRVQPAEDGVHLIVMSSEANYKVVQDLIKTVGTVPSDRTMQIYKLKNTTAPQLVVLLNAIISNKGLGKLSGVSVGGPSNGVHSSRYWKRIAENGGSGFDSAPSPSRAGQASDVMLMPEARLNWIIAIMRSDLKADVETLIQEFDIAKSQNVQLRTISVSPGMGYNSYSVIYRMFSNQIANSAETFYLYPADDNAHLLVVSSPENFKLIEDAVKALGAEPGKQEVQVYPMKNSDAYLVANLLVSTLPTKGRTVRLFSPGADVTLVYDQRLNWIIATMKPEVKPELEALIQQFDVPKSRDIQLRTIDLKGASAAKMAATLTSMIALQPVNTTRDIIRIMPSDDNARLIVMSTEANYKVVQDLIDTIGIVPNNRVVEIYQLTNAEAPSIIGMINSIISGKGTAVTASAANSLSPTNYSSYRSYYRHLSEAMSSGGGAGGNGDLMLIPDMRLNWVIAIMKPELKKEVDELVKQFDVPRSSGVQARIIDLKGGNAATMATTLSRLVDSLPGASPSDIIRIVPAEDNGRLIVMSSEANFKTVEGMVQTIGVVPTNRIVEVYRLTNAQAPAIISLVNTMIASKGLGTTNAAAGGSAMAGGMSSFRSYRRMAEMGMMSGASAGSTADLQLIPEARLNWVIAVMKPELKAEVDALVKQFDVQRTREVQTHLIDLKGGNAAKLSTTLDALIQDYLSDFMDDHDPNNYVRIQAADDNARLIVIANEANFKMIEEMVQAIGTVNANRLVEVYKLAYADPISIISLVNSVITNRGLGSAATAGASMPSSGGGDGGRSYLRRMMAQSMAGGAGGQNTDLLMIPDPRLNWVIAIMKPELKTEVDALFKQFDVEKTKQVQFRTLELKKGNAAAVANTITRLLQDQIDENNPADALRISATDDNAHLIVMSSEANYKLVEELATSISTVPNNRVVETYQLVYADAAAIAATINSIIQGKGMGAASISSGGSSAPASGDRSAMRSFFFRRMSEAMSSSSGQTADLVFIPDTRLNWLVAIMKPELKTEVDALIKQFDVDGTKDVTVRMIEVKNSSAQTLAATINGLILQPAEGPQGQQNTRDTIKVSAAEDNKRLIVMSSEANYKLIQGLVETLDNVPDDRVVDIYKLTYADASELTTLLNNVISKSPMMKGGGSGATVAGGAYGRYSRYMMSQGGSLGSMSGASGFMSRFGGTTAPVQVGSITMIPETRLNWIIVICPKDQKTELDAMVKQFDIEKPKDIQTRVIEVKHVDANDIAQNLNQLLRQQAQSTGRREFIQVTATDDGQRLLVLSTEANFKDVQEMVKTLDVELTKDVQARMIDVKYAEATTLATTINSVFRDQLFGSYYGGGTKRELVRVSATDDGQRLMVMSSESNYKMIMDMVKQLDTPESATQSTRVFKIEHLEAQALADQLTRLFQERARTQSSGSMYGGGYFGYSGGGGGRTQTQVPQPSIVPSPRTNTIMVMARAKDLPFIEEMIKELDVPIDSENFVPRIYKIRNTDANEVVTVLQNLFEGRSTGSSRTTNINYYMDSWRPNRGSDTGDAIQQVFGKLRFVVDRVTNTLVVLSSNPKNYEIIDKVVKDIDKEDPENSEVMVFDLKYADALKVANQVNLLFSEGTVNVPRSNTQTQQQRSTSNQNDNNSSIGGDDTINQLEDEVEQDFTPLWGNSPTARAGQEERPINTMIGKVRVVPDVRSNKLMVAAPPVYFNTLTKLVESLDRAEPQVFISTRILEITRGKERRIGIRWTPDPKSIDPAELDNALLTLGQLGFIDSFGGGDTIDPTKPTGMAVTRNMTSVGGSSVGSKTVTSTLKNGNSVISADVNLALLIQLLMKNSSSRVYTEPGVTVNNNETGNIFFGSEYPFRVTSTTNLNGNNQTVGIRYRPVGINLDIRPHINQEDEVVLKTAVENSNVRAEMIDGQIIKDMRRFTTEVSLKSGETMVIGGILIDDGNHTRRGVPVLRDLPVLKYVFGKEDEEQNLRELVFFVTPEVLNNGKDVQRILDQTRKEIRSIESMDLKNQKDLKTLQQIEDVQAPVDDPASALDAPEGKTSSEAGNGAAEGQPKYSVRRSIKADLPAVEDEMPIPPPQASVQVDPEKNPAALPKQLELIRAESAPPSVPATPKVKPVVVGKPVEKSSGAQ